MGEIIDEKGYKWYGHTEESAPETPIMDTGTGAKRVIRIFVAPKMSKTVGMHANEVYDALLPFIKDSLYASGLTTDDNHAPEIMEAEDHFKIIIVAKPVGTRMDIYEGMREGEGTVKNIAGAKIISHKTDNINTLLARKPNG